MKKALIAMAVVCAAAVSQAAALAWSVSGLTETEDGTGNAVGLVAYFMDGSTYETFSGLEADKVGAYCADNYLYTATTTSGRTGVTAAAKSGNYTAGDSVSGYIVIFDNASATAAKYYANTASETKNVPASGDLSWAKAFSATSGWVSTTPLPVPEPCSVALVLLGVAALGLKRKIA